MSEVPSVYIDPAVSLLERARVVLQKTAHTRVEADKVAEVLRDSLNRFETHIKVTVQMLEERLMLPASLSK